MSANGKGIVAALALMILIGFGIVNPVFQTEKYGFNVRVEVTGINVISVGTYDITGEITVENTNENSATLFSVEISVYSDESMKHTIIEFTLENKIRLEASEAFNSGSQTARINLENDDIPDSVYIVVDNLNYMYEGERFDKSWSGTQAIDLSDYL